MRRLLTMQLLSCALLSFSCQKKEGHHAEKPAVEESALGSSVPDATANQGESLSPSPPEPVYPKPDPLAKPILTRWEDQFWLYRLEQDALVFNTPWDKIPGHEIRKSAHDMPVAATDCLNRAKESFAGVEQSEDIKDRFARLLRAGATHRILFLVNVVPSVDRRNELRRLDRDAYFWHWNQQDRRPSLAFDNFKQGFWVWEVIAAPGSCVQPDLTDMKRYLDYAATRLGLL